jgi:beta-galactosidase
LNNNNIMSKKVIFRFLGIVFLICYGINVKGQENIQRNQLFDDSWKFFPGDVKGAEKPSFNDKLWRDIDLPHDWSVEKLPGQVPGQVVGPFSKESPGARATGYVLGGTAWYRKTFTLNFLKNNCNTIINFDGVYMDCDVWINGKLIGTHLYGYTAFNFDITGILKPAGQANVIAVKVRNEGKNSRWYSGSGIYRHVWLIQTQPVHISHNGVFITTQDISNDKAKVKISTVVENKTTKASVVKLMIRVIDKQGNVSQAAETSANTISAGSQEIIQDITISQPKLWSVEEPYLYTAEIQVVANGIVTDKVITTFGIRTIHFDAKTGFTLNGKKVLLKGGCMHHDNGFLGSATIDRAEERRVELMKAYGFNAIRTSHNPPSEQFLDACDRNGVLVIDEAFDMWERSKNPQDYHLYFKDWWQKDLESMILRDRNHPSVIFWSIGNEVNERADSVGYIITKRLADEVRRLDPTRPVTEAISGFWDHPGQDWSTTAPAFANLDIAGYNYLCNQYEQDHELFPERIMMGTESFPNEAYNYWQQVEKNPWVIGDFVWTAMDYLGEAGVGSSRLVDTARTDRRGFSRSLTWPAWFNAFCGDIDLCGFKKTQLLYRDIVWKNSRLEMVVHSPIPGGKREVVSSWGWPDELQSWNWEGNEGKMMDVRVFTSYPVIRLELNGKIIDEKTVSDTSRLIVNFIVPYEPGVLRAVALDNGIEVASKELRTTGAPAKIRLTADRTKIKADRNDLSYVRIEISDAQGNFIPNASIPLTLSVAGSGEIAGSGNACPYDMESFNNAVFNTYHGLALAILRPLKEKNTGMIILRAEANGLTPGEVTITVQ